MFDDDEDHDIHAEVSIMSGFSVESSFNGAGSKFYFNSYSYYLPSNIYWEIIFIVANRNLKDELNNERETCEKGEEEENNILNISSTNNEDSNQQQEDRQDDTFRIEDMESLIMSKVRTFRTAVFIWATGHIIFIPEIYFPFFLLLSLKAQRTINVRCTVKGETKQRLY